MKKNKLVLLGLDGADWKILDPLIKEGHLPNLKHIVENGSHARLRSTTPPITPVAWTSIFTGVNPGKHGIFDFFYFENGIKKFVNTEDVLVPYLWELLEKEKIIAFNIPYIYPIRKSDNAIIVSGFGTPSKSSDFSYPTTIKKEILEMDPDYETSVNLGAFLVGEIIKDKDEVYIESLKHLEDKKHMATYLIENKEWEIAIIVFSSPDWVQHLFISEFYKAKQKSLTLVGNIYRSIDEFLGYLIKKNYNIMIVSDHGFLEKKKEVFVNSYLLHSGLLKLKKPPIFKRAFRTFGISREFIKNTWPFSTVSELLLSINPRLFLRLGFKTLPSDKLHIDDIDNESSAYLVSRQGWIAISKNMDIEIVKRVVLDYKDENDKPFFKKLLLKEQLYLGTAVERCQPLFLVPFNDVLMNEKIQEPSYKYINPLNERSGYHDEFGIFISYGPDLLKKDKLADLSVFDITPTVISYFDYAIPSYMDGKKIDIFESSNTKNTKNAIIKASIKRLIKKKGLKI
ncbi:alkaline phosphatase family protein [Patescibacteria group bacterium]|nr:alkaline phosphatase family protein [Candidatus Micrarchaeota archaeon]MBU1758375.1 alkaline phosphatase family protein [Patescibacteria group bacterium]